MNHLDLLSPRERQIFDAIAAGHPPRQIAQDLGLSPKTVSTYRARLMHKLGIKTNAAIVHLCLDQELQARRDHSLIAAALCAGVARWESMGPTTGEFAVNGLRYFTRLQGGVPELQPALRATLILALSNKDDGLPEGARADSVATEAADA